jgi:hypothetical protein
MLAFKDQYFVTEIIVDTIYVSNEHFNTTFASNASTERYQDTLYISLNEFP